MYQNFIGIDIGKDSFCVCEHGQNKTPFFKNSKQGFKALLEAYQMEGALVVVEPTGGYERQLIKTLEAHKIMVHRADARKVKSFIWSGYTKMDSLSIIK